MNASDPRSWAKIDGGVCSTWCELESFNAVDLSRRVRASGHTRFFRPIGGGMGKVYRARDTQLDRTVAIKVLPPNISSNPDLRARFERNQSHPGTAALSSAFSATSERRLISAFW